VLVWLEGARADVPLFEGARTLLVGPRSYARGWTAAGTSAPSTPPCGWTRSCRRPMSAQRWCAWRRSKAG